MKRSLAMVLLLSAACSKAKTDDNQLPPMSPSAGAAPTGGAAKPADAPAPGADPHAGVAMGGGDPHAGAAMGGDPHGGMAAGGAPHGGMAAGGGKGGKTLTRTADGKAQLGPFLVAPPAGWEERPTTSSMRSAEWKLPGQGGEDAELVVYFFGSGGAGGIEANLERWRGQFVGADGAPAKASTRTAELKGKGKASTKVTTMEVEGRYVAAVTPGASEKLDKPDWKMLASIVESPSGPYYFKLTGPKVTVEKHAGAFHGMLKGMTLADGAAPAAGAAKDGKEGGW